MWGNPDDKDIALTFEWSVYSLFSDEKFNSLRESKNADKRMAERNGGALEPDMLFEMKDTGEKFWVDCAYRTSLGSSGSLCMYFKEGCTRRENDHLHLTDPVFMAVGIGGTTQCPESSCIISGVGSTLDICHGKDGRHCPQFSGLIL